jgi:hypothetical protein
MDLRASHGPQQGLCEAHDAVGQPGLLTQSTGCLRAQWGQAHAHSGRLLVLAWPTSQ